MAPCNLTCPVWCWLQGPTPVRTAMLIRQDQKSAAAGIAVRRLCIEVLRMNALGRIWIGKQGQVLWKAGSGLALCINDAFILEVCTMQDLTPCPRP
jgi:hypothetical protein